MTRWVKKVEDDVRQGACHLCIVGTKADLVREHPSRAAVSPQACSSACDPRVQSDICAIAHTGVGCRPPLR